MNERSFSSTRLPSDHFHVENAMRDTEADALDVPAVRIGLNCERITPDMLPLVELDQREIDTVVQSVIGGSQNVQDIYPLSPLQEGMLFHHLLNEAGDTYVLLTLLELESNREVSALIDALQRVIDRHEILRSAVLWERMQRPVQVIYRHVQLPVENMVLDLDEDPSEQLNELMRPERQGWNLEQAPLMRLVVVNDRRDRCYALLQIHHLICDHQSWNLVISEALATIKGHGRKLPKPAAYRDYVAWILAHGGKKDSESFFRKKLEEVEEATAPFGLYDVHGDGSHLAEARGAIDSVLAGRIRVQARRLGVSAARLFHAAWGLLVARTSGRDDVVYGTVLLASQRKNITHQPMLGLFVNALPLRLRLHEVTAQEIVQQVDGELRELLDHQQAPLTLAQRCSGSASGTPLFTAVLNYRYSVGHSVVDAAAEAVVGSGVRVLKHQYRTNYPVGLTVDNLGDGFALIAQTDWPIDPRSIIGYIQTAMQSLIEALEDAPHTPALKLSILPEGERHRVVEAFNVTRAAYPGDNLVHELIERQVERTPNAIAVMDETRSFTYAELNRGANQLARHLRSMGVGPGRLVALYFERCTEMFIGLLGVLKAGAAYLPLDPANPAERLKHVLTDAEPEVLVTKETMKNSLPWSASRLIALDTDWEEIEKQPGENQDAQALGLSTRNLAYVIYTSGSSGKPKGVMVEHRSIVNYAVHALGQFDVTSGIGSLICTSMSFDLALTGLYPTLLSGRCVCLCGEEHGLPKLTPALLARRNLAPLKLTPSHLPLLESALKDGQLHDRVRVLVLGGELLQASAVQMWRKYAPGTRIFNHYGPTETTVGCLVHEVGNEVAGPVPIGRPISNTRVFILDHHMEPVPIGVAGEVYIGGVGLARGYLNSPELTADRFIPDRFGTDPGARLYKSGDRGRWRKDGVIEYLGRNDNQVKIRGHRIELGEIEAQITNHAQVKEAVVVAREDIPGEKRLTAYVVADRNTATEAATSPEKQRNEVVSEWEMVHEETYRTNSIVGPSFIGWNSSYTGQAIPEPEMQEWLAHTVARIQALNPSKVLEIGCGVGLVLQHVAPECSAYVGMDLSASAIHQLKNWIGSREEFKHVELLQRSATDLRSLPDSSFDTVVLNSVVQYFPDIEYLLAVLQESVRLVGARGRIFIGDVRHLGSLPMFHSAVQLNKAGATVSVGQLRKRIARAVAQDKELVIDPRFFQVLPGRVPGISAVEVHLKRGRSPNELTRYRYDVVVHTGAEVALRPVYETLEWQKDVRSAANLEVALAQRHWCAARLTSIPDGRVAREAMAQRLIATSDEYFEVGALRRQLNELQSEGGMDVEEFWELAQAHAYDAHISPGDQGCFDVYLLDRARADTVEREALSPQEAVRPWGTYANDPLGNGFKQHLVLELREHLKSRLPDYMLPSGWMVLKQLPLTPNGKIDRRALPDPQGRPEDIGEYVAPSTELERSLAEIWTEVLQVDQVGVLDNFFELGGHSILAMQVVARIRSSLSIEMPMRLLFESPTVQQLSTRLKELRRSTPLDAILDDIEGGSVLNMEKLRERVAAMPDSEVQQLMQELKTRVGS